MAVLTFAWPCLAEHKSTCCSKDVWRVRSVSAIRVSTSELNRLAKKTVQPAAPILDTARVRATVRVKILVDESGKVICAKAIGHPNPLLGGLSAKAASEWKFEPLVIRGHRRKMIGVLVFHIKR